jgi:photosystem II stability/assembly factor-like uncharacterized protein
MNTTRWRLAGIALSVAVFVAVACGDSSDQEVARPPIDPTAVYQCERHQPPPPISCYTVQSPPPTPTPNPLFVRTSFPISAEVGWIGGAFEDSGFIAYTHDGGQTWERRYSGDIVVNNIQFVDANEGWASSDGNLLHTTDAGMHWTTVFTTARTIQYLAFTKDDGWIAVKPCVDASFCDVALMHTTDQGATWSEQRFAGRFLSFSRPTADDLFVLTADGLSASHDAGATWASVGLPESGRPGSAFFLTPQQGWLLVGGGPTAGAEPKEFFGTTDGGATWNHLAGLPGARWSQTETPENFAGGGYVGPIYFTSPTNGWMLLYRGGLFRSTDSGETWHDAFDGDYEFYDFHMASESDGWELGRRNQLWITSDAGESWRTVELRLDFD